MSCGIVVIIWGVSLVVVLLSWVVICDMGVFSSWVV